MFRKTGDRGTENVVTLEIAATLLSFFNRANVLVLNLA